MKVSDLAQELNTTSETILATLKSLKLKAKDSQQELNAAVISVLKSELLRAKKIPAPAAVTAPIKTDADAQGKDTVEKKPSARTKPKSTADQAEKTKVASKTPAAAVETPPAASKIPPKSKPRISKESFVILKPLIRKKRKPVGGAREEHPSEVPVSAVPQSIDGKVSVEAASSQEVKSAVSVESPVLPAAAVELSEEMTATGEKLAELEVRIPITVKEFSAKIQQKPSIVLKELMRMGLLAHINQSLDGGELINKLARHFGYALTKIRTQEEQIIETHKKEEENPELLTQRAPVITFMGHVDHGKTSLLDRIRKTKVTDTEHGGITQHIGSYSVQLPKGRITFLDTPGHEAFTAMRARGAHITDIVVLVVAADEGVMPQTEEAIDHARAANVPIVVALNKMDRKNADPDLVKKQLSERGLMPEEWGGKTVVVGVSALTGDGVDQLLELILLEAELLELKANTQKKASGIVVEAHLSQGKGAVTTLIVQSGTLREGDILVAGSSHGKVKAMMDDRGRAVKEAGPSMPIELLGLPEVPGAGEMFYVVDDEKQAREITSRRQEQGESKRLQATHRVTLEDLYSRVKNGEIKELNVILKADVQGSLEALKDSLEKIPSDKVKIKFIHMGVGDVSASDVLLAVVSKAIIIAFHIEIGPRAKEALDKEPVDVRQYRIIYDAVNDVRKALEGLLEAKTKKKPLGQVEIRQVFKLSKHGIVAGCYVTKGKVKRKDPVDILRNGEMIYSGTISSLKRFKDDVREVTDGMECGISFEGFDQFQSGDIIQAYEIERIAQTL